MLFSLIVASVVSLASCESCCAPMQWSGMESFITTTVPAGQVQASLTTAAFTIAFDGNAKMITTEGTSVVDGVAYPFKSVSNYNTKITYTVSNGTCTKAASDDFPGNCIPDDAEKIAVGKLGAGSTALDVIEWRFNMGNITAYFVTTADCIPVQETYSGMQDDKYVFNTISFTGITPGVDATKFNVPQECMSTPTLSPSGVIIG